MRKVGRPPTGLYNPNHNEGHVCLTTSSETPDLAVDVIQDRWQLHQLHPPQAKWLSIEADSGGSNGVRSRRFKKCLPDFAGARELEVTDCHNPPGTLKGNPIEHRLFNPITAALAG